VTALFHPDAINDDFNLSTAESTSVRQLAELIWHKIRGSDAAFRFVSDDPYEYDVQKRVPDVRKAKRVLGYEASTTLDQMLDEVIPWIEAAVAEGRL
jgi:UDP-glucose 4-epimerase